MKPRRTPPQPTGKHHPVKHFNDNGWCICVNECCLATGPNVRIGCRCPECPCVTGKKVTK